MVQKYDMEFKDPLPKEDETQQREKLNRSTSLEEEAFKTSSNQAYDESMRTVPA